MYSVVAGGTANEAYIDLFESGPVIFMIEFGNRWWQLNRVTIEYRRIVKLLEVSRHGSKQVLQTEQYEW